MTRKRSGLIVAVCAVTCLAIGGLMFFVTSQVDEAAERFNSDGVRTVATIIEFREVSSGRQPRRRTVAVATADGEIMASHILMSEGEIAALKSGQALKVLVLRADQLPETLLEGKLWFVTQSSVDRHLRSPARQWGWPAASVFLGAGCLLAVFALRKQA